MGSSPLGYGWRILAVGALAVCLACETQAPLPSAQGQAASPAEAPALWQARNPPAGAPSVDPRAPSISPLARLSRLIFARMRSSQCVARTGFAEDLSYAMAVTVKGGKVTGATLGSVTTGRPEGGGRELAAKEIPAGLRSYFACLKPELQAMTLEPPVADGSYKTVFSIAADPEASGGAAKGK